MSLQRLAPRRGLAVGKAGWAYLALYMLTMIGFTAFIFPVIQIGLHYQPTFYMAPIVLAHAMMSILIYAYLINSFAFQISIMDSAIVIRYASNKVRVSRDDVAELAVLQGGSGWRYIGLLHRSRWTVITNSLFSDKDFSDLADAIKSWVLESGGTAAVKEGMNGPGKLGSYSFRFGHLPTYIGMYATALALMFGLALATRPLIRDGATGAYVKLQCSLTTAGDLRHCRVVEENPTNAGFGAAALRLARE